MRFLSQLIITCTLALGLQACASETRGTQQGPPPHQGELDTQNIALMRVPLNEIRVLDPYDGASVRRKDLKVTIASGYGVLTFVSITMNGKLAVPMKNIEANQIGKIIVPGKHLKPGKNTMLVNSWHQMPNQKIRMAKFKHPIISFVATR
jgi:hypothetical protein